MTIAAYVLIEPADLALGDVFYAETWDALRDSISDHYAALSAKARGSEDEAYHLSENRSLLEMLDTLPGPLAAGVHQLKPIEPHWYDWVLIVVGSAQP